MMLLDVVTGAEFMVTLFATITFWLAQFFAALDAWVVWQSVSPPLSISALDFSLACSAAFRIILFYHQLMEIKS